METTLCGLTCFITLTKYLGYEVIRVEVRDLDCILESASMDSLIEAINEHKKEQGQ